MFKNTITRKQLQDAIEAGIANAGYDRRDPSAAAALRRVGRTANEVAVGCMRSDGVGCPLVQAGLPLTLTGCFYGPFDDSFPSAEYGSGVLRVVA